MMQNLERRHLNKSLNSDYGDLEKAKLIAFLKKILEKEMATHSSVLAWEIPWAEEPGGLQCVGSQNIWIQLSTYVLTV